ncbi:hypothetical protein GQ600_15102 [Phytophthora cactorum]|nr:hypothetical protein GQ600_15102 [Phytophthora cactorum]
MLVSVDPEKSRLVRVDVYVNKEKKRRDAARASLIVHEWAERDRTASLVRTPALKLNTVASHEKLCALYDKLMAKDEKIVGLRSKLKNQLTTKNSDQDRCKKLQELSSRLESELRERDMLDKEREKLSTELMCVDKGVRKTVGQGCVLSLGLLLVARLLLSTTQVSTCSRVSGFHVAHVPGVTQVKKQVGPAVLFHCGLSDCPVMDRRVSPSEGILDSQPMTLEQFMSVEDRIGRVREFDPWSRPIPLLLRPQEMAEQYNKQFDGRLQRRKVPTESLQDDPLVATKTVPAEGFLTRMESYCPNGYVQPTRSLKAIPIVLSLSAMKKNSGNGFRTNT